MIINWKEAMRQMGNAIDLVEKSAAEQLSACKWYQIRLKWMLRATVAIVHELSIMFRTTWTTLDMTEHAEGHCDSEQP
jgi:hypothetical protein